jgi:hypothetical protein
MQWSPTNGLREVVVHVDEDVIVLEVVVHEDEDVVVLGKRAGAYGYKSPKTLSPAYPEQDHWADEVRRQLLTQAVCAQSLRWEWQRAATQREKREVS